MAYRTDEAAKLVGIGRTKLFELLKSGALPSKRIGRTVIVLRADLEAFLANLPHHRTN